jgi:hypothetical protein
MPRICCRLARARLRFGDESDRRGGRTDAQPARSITEDGHGAGPSHAGPSSSNINLTDKERWKVEDGECLQPERCEVC